MEKKAYLKSMMDCPLRSDIESLTSKTIGQIKGGNEHRTKGTKRRIGPLDFLAEEPNYIYI